MSKKTTVEAAVLSIAPDAASECIEAALNIRRPFMLWGPPGIGKSELVHQVGDKLGRNVRDLRLALYDPTDIKGMPFMDGNQMKWAPSSEFPSDPNSTDILFLDELVSAPPSVQAAAYQLILNRRVGEYVLPKGCDIIAAGNRENDRGVTYKMPKPLANRFIHAELRVDANQWINHAIKNKIHKDIIGYISHLKQDLFTFDPSSASHSFATPRSWFFVDQILKNSKSYSKETVSTMISGSVGDGIAVKFLQHCKIADQLPLAKDVLEGKVTSLNIKDISACYSLIISLCYEIKSCIDNKIDNIVVDEYLENYINFMMNNFEPEMIMTGVRILISNYDIDIDVSTSKAYDKFHTRFEKYLSR